MLLILHAKAESHITRKAVLLVYAIMAGAVVLWATPARAQAEPFSLEELLSIPDVGDVLPGPSGSIAWVEQSRGTANIFVAAAPDFEARRLTAYEADDGAPIDLIGFASGGERVLFARGITGFNPANAPDPVARAILSVSLRDGSIERVDAGAASAPLVDPEGNRLIAVKGGEVWSYPLSGKGEGERLFSARGALRDLVLSPDGSKLAFISDRSAYDRGKYAFVGVFDLAERRIAYMAPGVGYDQNIVWSPDGARIAFIRFGYEPRTWRFSDHREGAPFEVVVADAESGEGGAVWRSSRGYGSRFSGFGASGYSGLGGRNSLFWTANDLLVFPYEKTGWKLLYGVSLSGGEARLLTPGAFEIAGAALSPDRRRIIYGANAEDDLTRLDLYALSIDEAQEPRIFGESAERGMRRNAMFGAGGVVYYLDSGEFTPERLMARSASGETRQLSTGPKPGDPITKKAAPAETLTFKSLDGLEIPAILYRPKTIEGKGRHPVIVHAHGGPRGQVYPAWQGGFGPTLLQHYYVSRGYFVLHVNFRSGVGYGLDFREPESYGGRGAGDVQDFIAAARYLKRHVPEIDAERMAIFGHSYGGHIVSNVLARSDVYAAGVDGAGVGDWVVEMEKDIGEELQFNIPERLELERLAYESSAISRIDQWGEEPILFIHGDNDNQAAMQQTLELYLALLRRGKTVDALILPEEGHFISLGRNQVKYLRKMEAFFEKHLNRKE